MLECHRLGVAYGHHQALQGVDIRVAPGEIVVILGANGAGKTTLLNAVAGLVPASAASRITLAGRTITGLAPHAIVEAGLALVPEGRGIFGELTVRENLLLGAFAHRARAQQQANLDRVLALFPKLAERSAQRAHTMSGGEQQMVAIGRALMSAPAILMLDEPSLGLSPLLCGELFKALAAVRQTGVGILLVEQNARLSLAIADRAYLLENGQVVGEGPADQLARDPAVQAAYLGGAASKATPGRVATAGRSAVVQAAPPAGAVAAAQAATPVASPMASAAPMPAPMPLPFTAAAGRSVPADALIPARIADLVQAAARVQAADVARARSAMPAARAPTWRQHPTTGHSAPTTDPELAAALAGIESAARRARQPASAPKTEPRIEHRRFDHAAAEHLPTIEVWRRPTVQIYRRSKDGKLIRGD